MGQVTTILTFAEMLPKLKKLAKANRAVSRCIKLPEGRQ